MDYFDELVDLFQHSHYLGIFVILVLSGIGLPVPEEVTFVASGYMVHLGCTKFVPTVIVGYVGIIVGDIIAYFLGLRYGARLYGMWPFRYILTPQRLAKVKDHFTRHGTKTVFLAGFAMGFRVATFFVSGSMGVSLAIFILMDTLRILITMPISIWAGKYFGSDIDDAWVFLGEVRWYVILFVAVLAAFFVARHCIKKKICAGGISGCGRTSEPPPDMTGAISKVGESTVDSVTSPSKGTDI